MTFAPSPSLRAVPSASMPRSSESGVEMSGYRNPHLWGERIGNFLRAAHPLSTAKLVSRDLDVPVRTVEKWLDGTAAPSLDAFMRMLGFYGPGLLLATFPGLAWAEIIKVAFDTAALEAQLAAMPAKRERAVAALRAHR